MGHIDIPRPISATVSISVLINGLPSSSTSSSDATIDKTEEPSEEKKTSKANKTPASAGPAESTHAVRVEIWNAHEAEQVAMGRDELSVPCLVLSGAINAGLNRLPGTLSPRSTHHYP